MDFSTFVFGVVEGGLEHGQKAVETAGNAAQGAAQGGMSAMGSGYILIMIAVFVVMMVFSGRKQKKAQQQHAEMLNNLKEGDKVITTSGIIGEIAYKNDDIVELRVDKGTKIKFAKSKIVGLYNK